MALRTTAWMELHAFLALGAKMDTDAGEDEPARLAYAKALRDDDEDLAFRRVAAALARCSDDRCALAAVAGESYGEAYARALPGFTRDRWRARATGAFVGIEAIHGVFGNLSDALLRRAASDLLLTWPDGGVPVHVVAEAPPPSRAALLPPLLATKSACFFRPSRREPRELVEARILDCVLVHAILGAPSAIRDALVAELGDHDGERAFTLLAIHVAAVLVTGTEKRHVSVYRQSANAIDAPRIAWLTKEWLGQREPPMTFVARWAEYYRESMVEPRP